MPKSTELLTTTHRGRTLLAKRYHEHVFAVTYANRTQAIKRAEQLTAAGTPAAIFDPVRSRCTFVEILAPTPSIDNA